jgi:hypothetical protein
MDGVNLIKIHCKHIYVTMCPPVQLLYAIEKKKVEKCYGCC